MKKTDLKSIMISEDWSITDLEYNETKGVFSIKAKHISGYVLELCRDKEEVDKILNDIENEEKN